MKEKIKRFFCLCILILALPYIITAIFQGKALPSGIEKLQKTDLRQPQTKQEEVVSTDIGKINIEEYLIGVVAKEISVNLEPEAIKAQTVVARTNLVTAIRDKEELPASVSQDELMEIWGKDSFRDGYQRLEQAIAETERKIITYQGQSIYAAYHAVSAGHTRNAKEALGYSKMPWLQKVDSTIDIPSKNYLKVEFLTPESFSKKLKSGFPEIKLPKTTSKALVEFIKIKKRDGSDYVTELTLGKKEVTGEEFRTAFSLNSACFYLSEVEGKLRFVTKGLGHGLGLSQFGANEMAKDGWGFQEILKYYYKNIEISD
jgi:stage II sporulation protein D